MLWSMEPDLWHLSPATLDKIRGMYSVYTNVQPL